MWIPALWLQSLSLSHTVILPFQDCLQHGRQPLLSGAGECALRNPADCVSEILWGLADSLATPPQPLGLLLPLNFPGIESP